MLIGCSAFAQSSRGTISGTVADPAGAVTAGATIDAKNTETGAVHQAGTSVHGGIIVLRIQFWLTAPSRLTPSCLAGWRQGATLVTNGDAEYSGLRSSNQSTLEGRRGRPGEILFFEAYRGSQEMFGNLDVTGNDISNLYSGKYATEFPWIHGFGRSR
jgi:hypothetical protein